MTMKDNLWRAANDLPQCFSYMLNALNSFNIKGPIDYYAEPDNNDEDDDNYTNIDYGDNDYDEEEDQDDDSSSSEPTPPPDVIREVHFTMKKMSDGTLQLVVDYSNMENSINVSSTVSAGDHEILELHSSGIQDSTIEQWD